MTIEVIKGDITKLDVDAIVNAANNRLVGGGGVDGAIHRAGGPAIMEECDLTRRAQGGCPTGEAVVTTGGRLPARYVIHTVGPVWTGGSENEPKLLKNAYYNSLKLAIQKGLRTIAFPNISTGVYGYPKSEAAKVAVQTAKEFQYEYKAPETVFFVCFDDENYNIYKNLLQG